jgi:hypothetical protein
VPTDDRGAQKLGRTILAEANVQNTQHLYAWLYFTSPLRGRRSIAAPCAVPLWQLGISTLGAFRDELGRAAEMKNAHPKARVNVLVASQGFEPRLIGSEPTVLPLNEEAKSAFAYLHSGAFRAPDHFPKCTDSMGFGQREAVDSEAEIQLRQA